MKPNILGVVTLLGCSVASAGSEWLDPVVSLQGGYASINAGMSTQSFVGTDDEIFTYTPLGNTENTGFIGVFLGTEHALPWVPSPGLLMQVGVTYNYFANVYVHGTNTVGIQSETNTLYNTTYNYRPQQLLGTLKLLTTTYECLHPYGQVDLGGAFNYAGQYNASTEQEGSLNITPDFNNHNQTQFSYNLGLGLDVDVHQHVRVGFGYQYSNFGGVSLGNGVVEFNDYQANVPFTLSSSNAYANQFIMRISYVA
jgi:opacity protein-like surface antigen